MRILVVEDSAAQRDALVALLEDEGFSVDAAATATEATTLYLRKTHDLVIMDYTLPDRPAPSLIADLRRVGGGTSCAIVCVTGSVELVETAHGLDFQPVDDGLRSIGADACLAKPVDFDELLQVIAGLRD